MRDSTGMNSGLVTPQHSASSRSVKITPQMLFAFAGTPINTVERNAKRLIRNNKCERFQNISRIVVCYLGRNL